MAKTNAPAQITIKARSPSPAVDLSERVREMSSADLSTLRANALRLLASSSAKFQGTASKMLPLIEAEIDARRQSAPAAKPGKAARTARTTRKTAKPASD